MQEAADTLAPKVRTSLLTLRSAIRNWHGERFCLLAGAQWIENILRNIHLRVLAGTRLLQLASAPTVQDRELWIWSPLQAPERAVEDISAPGLLWTTPETRHLPPVLCMVPYGGVILTAGGSVSAMAAARVSVAAHGAATHLRDSVCHTVAKSKVIKPPGFRAGLNPHYR